MPVSVHRRAVGQGGLGSPATQLMRAVGLLGNPTGVFGAQAVDVAWCPCYHDRMIVAFRGQGTRDIFNGVNSRAARKTCPETLWKIAARKLDLLDSATTLDELRVPPGNRLEALSGDRKGNHSIRINEQYRICFQWTEKGPDQVEIVDYH